MRTSVTGMTRLTIGIGAALVVAGVVAYLATMTSITALIPAFVGLPILLCGIVGAVTRKPRIPLHIALVIALLGAAGSVMNVVKIGQLFDGSAERPAAIIVSLVLFVLTVVYLALGIRSFVTARRARTA